MMADQLGYAKRRISLCCNVYVFRKFISLGYRYDINRLSCMAKPKKKVNVGAHIFAELFFYGLESIVVDHLFGL